MKFLNVNALAVVATICLSAFILVFSAPNASAYTCDYSGDGGSSSHTSQNGNWNGNLVYENGSCILYKPNDGAKSEPVGASGKCRNDGDPKKVYQRGTECFYDLRPEYTNQKPTYNNGDTVEASTWEKICNKSEGYPPESVRHYNADLHRCESDYGGFDDCGDIFSQDRDSIDEEDCIPPGFFGTKSPDDIKKDETKPKSDNPAIDECDTKYPLPANTVNPTTKEQGAINLNTACKDGASGSNCDALYKNRKDSEFNTVAELKKACQDGSKAAANPDVASGVDGSNAVVSDHCGQARVNLLGCGTAEGNVALNNILKIIIMALSALVGVAAVGGLTWAALQYAKAEDDSGKVSEARTLIRNIVIGILLYGFLFVIINWLIPGGIIQ